jgi:hypothetical protein
VAVSDEVIFAWAIGKALLIVITSFGILLYVAWAGTRRMLQSSGKQRSTFPRVTKSCPDSTWEEESPISSKSLDQVPNVFQ